MLLLTALLSIVMGLFVSLVGQDEEVKPWFILLCINVALLTAGLWVEVHSLYWTFFAARVVMTSALVAALMALMCARVMCNLTLHPAIVAMLALAVLFNVATVWLSNTYFTGTLIQYSWGNYVGGNPRFILNPILVAAIAVYALFTLWLHYNRAHPLDKNRTNYMFAANLILASASLDYLPHFGIDLFGGPISGLVIPIFLAMYGYAMLRYRLFDFREFVGRFTGWSLAVVVMITSYTVIVEAGKRLAGCGKTMGFPLGRI